MAEQFNSVFAKKLNAFMPLSRGELECLDGLQAKRVKIKRGQQLTREGQTGHKVFVLHDGWACSYKDLASGHRQIITFPIAGDCVGLRSVLLRTADHSFSALTDAVNQRLQIQDAPDLVSLLTIADVYPAIYSWNFAVLVG